MTIPYALVLACLLAVLATRPADAREWRSWCGPRSDPDRDATPSLGWHFYCDPNEEGAEEDATATPTAPPPARSSRPETAMDRILKMRRALEEARSRAILDPNAENVTAYLHLQQEALQRAASFSDVFRRTVWASPGSRLHPEASGGRPGQAGLVGASAGPSATPSWPGSGSVTASSISAMRDARDAACSARFCAPLRSVTASTCSRSP